MIKELIDIIDSIWIESDYSFNKREAERKLFKLLIINNEEDRVRNRVKIRCLNDLINYISTQYKVSIHNLRSDGRTRELVVPRQMYCYIAKKLYPTKILNTIGKEINRDHSSVLHSVKTIKQDMKTDPSLRNDLSRFLDEIILT